MINFFISSILSKQKEIVKLKERVEAAENQDEFVKELVRGLDDESPRHEILKTKDIDNDDSIDCLMNDSGILLI